MSSGSFYFETVSEPMSILTWQAQHGFPGISLPDLEFLANELCVEIKKLASKASYRDTLVLALVLRLLGEDIGEERALDILWAANSAAEGPLEEGLCDLTDEVIHDYMLVGEQADAVKLLKEHRQATESRLAARASIAHACKVFYPAAKRAAADGVKKTAATKAAKAKAAKEAAARSARFVVDLSQAPRALLRREMSPDASCIEDDSNGRFLFSAPGRSRRSISWTLRGEQAAVRQALQVMWEWHCERTGGVMPEFLA